MIGVDDFESPDGTSPSRQFHGVLKTCSVKKERSSVQDNPSYEGVDVFYKYTTSESDPLLHSALHAAGYDEEKKWDANSLSYSSVDPPIECKHEVSTYNLSRKDSLEMTGSDDGDQIFSQLDTDCLAENTGWLLSGMDQKYRHNQRQIGKQLVVEVAESPIDCEDIIQTSEDALDTGPSTYDAAWGSGEGGLYKQIENEAHDDFVEATEHCDDQQRIADEALDTGPAACDKTPCSVSKGLDAAPAENEGHDDVVEASEHGDDQQRIADEALDTVPAVCDKTPGMVDEGQHAAPTENEGHGDIVEATEHCDDQQRIGDEALDTGPAAWVETRCSFKDELEATPTKNEGLNDVVESFERCDDQLRIDRDESHINLAQDATRGISEEGPYESQIKNRISDDVVEAAKDCGDQLPIAKDDSYIGLASQELAPGSFEDRLSEICEVPLQTGKEGSNVDAATCYTELHSLDIGQSLVQIENDEPDFIAEAFCCCMNTSRGGNEESDVDAQAELAERENKFFDAVRGFKKETDIGATPCDAEQYSREDGLNAAQRDFTEERIAIPPRKVDSTAARVTSCEVVVVNRRCDRESGFSRIVPKDMDVNEALIDKSVDSYKDDMDTQFATVKEIHIAVSATASDIYESDNAETVVTPTDTNRTEGEVDSLQEVGLGRIIPSDAESLEIDGDKLRGSDRDSQVAIPETKDRDLQVAIPETKDRDSQVAIPETKGLTGKAAAPIERQDHVARPPLFPSERVDLHENPDKLLSLLSSKLLSQKPAQRGADFAVIASSADKLFDPNLSVFARMESDTYGTLEISPPGSPKSPFFFIEDDAFSSDESCSVPSLTALCSMVHPEIAQWDMVPSAYSLIQNHPELILTGDLVDDSETIVSDLLHSNANWTDTCALHLASNEYKETSSSAPPERTTSLTDTFNKVTVSSTSESVCGLQRAPDTSTSSSCASSPHYLKDRSNDTMLLLSRSGEETGLQDANNRARHTSELRRTVSLSNLQTLKKKSCSLNFSSASDDKDKEQVQLGNGSLVAGGDEEEKSNIHLLQTLDASLKVEKLVSCLHACRDGCIRYMVSLHWKQLQALWLHNEASQSSFLDCTSTMHATLSNSDADEHSYFNSVATSHCMTVNSMIHELQLCSSQKFGVTYGSSAYVNDLLRLSSFFSMDEAPERSLLKHKILLEKGREAESLLTTASSRLSTFSEIVRSICGHASVSDDAIMNFEEAESGVRYLIDVKTAQAIQSKAAFKYDGDMLQVKDILRAKIIFPNEGALLCGLARLKHVGDARGQNSNYEDHQTKVRVVRIKNLFHESSSSGGLVRSTLPTGYRHVLVNVEMNDDFITGKCIFIVRVHQGCSPLKLVFVLLEIQLNLSAFYDVLGDKGPILHKDLCNLQATLTSKSLEFTSFDMCTFIEWAPRTTPPCELTEIQDAGETFKAEVSASMETEKISADLRTVFDGTEAPRSVTMEWIDMDLGGMISDTLKGDLLDKLREDTTTLCDEERSLALLECAFACASEKLEDLVRSFCLCSVVLYCVRHFPTSKNFKLRDIIGEPAGLLGLSRSYLVKSLSVCLNVRLEEQEIDDEIKFGKRAPCLLNLLALTYAEEGRWNDAASVLETLILMCEERYTKVNPILITAMLDLASMSRRAGNHSHAGQLLMQVTERVSMLLVETEASYMEYLRNASRDTTNDAPLFYLDDGRDSFEILRQFVIVFQQVDGQVDLQRFRDPWICWIYHRILGDSFAVLANCEQATWLYLSTNSIDHSHMETIRYYWSCALSHFEKAFEGFSAVAGLENRDVSGAIFGMVRCLRELGETDKALELLSMMVAGLENVTHAPQDPFDSDLNSSSSPCYVAHALLTTQQGQNADHPCFDHHIVRALCLWWMSILSVDKNKGQEGRNRAFRFLHTSSLSLQLALTEMHPNDEDTRKVCVNFLETIEQEAKNISQQG
jgi:hypothetical protein